MGFEGRGQIAVKQQSPAEREPLPAPGASSQLYRYPAAMEKYSTRALWLLTVSKMCSTVTGV